MKNIKGRINYRSVFLRINVKFIFTTCLFTLHPFIVVHMSWKSHSMLNAYLKES